MSEKQETDDDAVFCERCNAQHEIGMFTATEDGCYICPACWRRWQEHIAACRHEWARELERDSNGELARYCPKCASLEVVPTLVDRNNTG